MNGIHPQGTQIADGLWFRQSEKLSFMDKAGRRSYGEITEMQFIND